MGSECSTRIAIIVAAGSGTRFGAKKQFIEVNGKPLYYYSVKTFSKLTDKVILVVPKEDAGRIEPFGATVVAGGANRYDSVYAGLKLCPKNSLIAIHDAARPGVTDEVINKAFEAAEKFGAAVPVVPVTDTIRNIDGELIDRSTLRAMQTPQTFKGEVIISAYEKLMNLTEEKIKEMRITDDVQVAHIMTGIKAHFSDGDVRNLKVTTTQDLNFLQLL